jgi:hypothetical protein
MPHKHAGMITDPAAYEAETTFFIYITLLPISPPVIIACNGGLQYELFFAALVNKLLTLL